MGDNTMKIMKSLNLTEGEEKAMQINYWEFKIHVQKYMSNTCLVISSLPQEALVAIN